MSALDWLLPWESQPQEVVSLDRDNPLVRGIVMHVPFHPSWGMRDIVRGNPVTATGLASTNTSSRGISPLFGTSNFADLTDTTGIANLTDPVTIAWVQKFVSPSANSTVLHWKLSGAARTALAGYQSTSSSYRFSFGTSANEWNLSAVASPVDGEERVCVLVCRAGLESATAGDFSIYINGVDQGTPGATTFGSNTTAGMRVGAALAGTDPFEGGISRLTIWNRPLLERDALEWSASPDVIYEPQTIWVPVSAGGGGSGFQAAWARNANTMIQGGMRA